VETFHSSPSQDRRGAIAVLPFAYLSGDPEQEYFTDGMVEEIIRALSRIRWLFVIARNSSFTISDRAAGSDPSRFQRDHAINLGRCSSYGRS